MQPLRPLNRTDMAERPAGAGAPGCSTSVRPTPPAPPGMEERPCLTGSAADRPKVIAEVADGGGVLVASLYSRRGGG